MKEAQLKKQIAEYLQIGVNQGKWYADRLNAGEVIIVQGKSRRRVKLCREGTADFFVVKHYWNLVESGTKIIFLEAKGDKGMQRQEQKDFQEAVETQGASYFLVRSLDEVVEILGETT